VPLLNLKGRSFVAKAFSSGFLIFWFLTINHSAMRIAMPAFMYGLSVLIITNPKLVRVNEAKEE
jgi:hypothetical protein